MIELRPYQKDLVSKIRKAMGRHKHIIVSSPTASGKTVVFSYIAKGCIDKGNKILILSNRYELLTQAGGTLDKFGIKSEYISPEFKGVPTGNCIVAMAQTLQRRYKQKRWDLLLRTIDVLIIDECHIQFATYLFESGIFDNIYVLGFSATPKRTGNQRQLGIDYDEIIEGITVKQLIKLGYLVPAKHYVLDAPDCSKVPLSSTDGDYNPTKMFKVFDTNERYDGAIENYKKISPNSSFICFCCSQAHAIKTCIEFNAAGIPSKFIVSGFQKDDDNYQLLEDNKHLTGDRDVIFDDFRSGKFLGLINASIATTGTDLPICSTIIILRASLSQALVRQMYGRGGRLYEGKRYFNILDFGNNVKKHGTYESDIKYSLWHDTRESSGIPMTKLCDPEKKDKNGKNGCGALVMISAQICPCRGCGFVFATEKEIRNIELVELLDGKFKFSEMTALELDAYRELHGYNKNWVFRQLWVGGGERGLKAGMKQLGYDWKFIYRTKMMYEKQKKRE